MLANGVVGDHSQVARVVLGSCKLAFTLHSEHLIHHLLLDLVFVTVSLVYT